MHRDTHTHRCAESEKDADPEQLRSSIRMGISFNIIDGKRGEKADLSPLTRDSRYRQAFARRIRYDIKWPGEAPFTA